MNLEPEAANKLISALENLQSVGNVSRSAIDSAARLVAGSSGNRSLKRDIEYVESADNIKQTESALKALTQKRLERATKEIEGITEDEFEAIRK